jgi:2'-5' RNA ligase
MTTLHEEMMAGRALWIGLFTDESIQSNRPHCTLLHCGKYPAQTALPGLIVRALAQLPLTLGLWREPVVGRVGGVARFRGESDGDPIVHLLQQPMLRVMRADLLEQLEGLGWTPRRTDFDYTPHVTLGRVLRGQEMPMSGYLQGESYVFTHVGVVCGRVSWGRELSK